MDNQEALIRFERYLNRRSPGRSTAKHYLSDVRIFLAACPKPWAEVTRADIDAFVDRGGEAGWKPATIRRRVAALKAFFDFCAEETGRLDEPNPVCFSRHAPKRGHRLPRDVSNDTVRCLWSVIESPRDQVIFALMLRAGLRVGEVVALTPADILAPATSERPARLRVQGKGRKERVVYLSADAYGLLAHYMQMTPSPPEEPVFRSWRGQPLTVAGVQSRLRHYCGLAEVHVTCHQLRHTFARQMAEEDMSVLNLSKLLGHTDLATTQLYIEGADPHLRQAYSEAMTRWEAQDNQTAPVEVAAMFPAPPNAQAAFGPLETPQPALFQGEDWALDLPAWVRESCLAYVRQRQLHWKPSQRQRHARRMLRALAGFWRWQLAQRSLDRWDDLTRDDLQSYIDHRLAAGRAASTVKNVIYSLWGVLRLLAEQGIAVPPSLFRLRLPKEREALPRPLSEARAQRLERHVRQTLLEQEDPQARRDAAWFFVLLHTGIRLSELLDLRRADLDLEGARLRICEGKGRRDRVVYLSHTALLALQRYLAQAPRQPEDPLFQRAGRPLRERWVQHRLQALGEAVGVPGVSPHRLRHTFATRLVSFDVPVQRIQRLMGHKNLNTTQRYIRISDKAVEQDYQRAMVQIERGEVPLSLQPVLLFDWLPLGSIIRVTVEIPNSM
ncbi:MAG: tyrosine-type recombinase/integrase [Anaerolineales bacterium]|nr:tyrosine-type recombinase/integrase [Anaerolineales bacterium]